MSDRSTVLLEHHLKELKLPTFLREYGKVAGQCAAEDVDHPGYLLRLAEPSSHGGPQDRGCSLPRHQEPRHLRLPGHAVGEQAPGHAAGTLRVRRPAGERHRYRQQWGPARPMGPSAWDSPPARGGCRSASPPPTSLVHVLIEARDERRLLNLQKKLARLKLLIIDELGFVPLSKTGAELLFEVFSQRYERGVGPGHHQVSPSTSGLRSSARRDSPAPCWIASLTEFTSWR